jgi:hypothetical protein
MPNKHVPNPNSRNNRAARLLENSSDRLRKAAARELEKMGFSLTSERYISASIKNPTAKTASVSKRQYRQKRVMERVGESYSLERAAALRKSGELSYETAAGKQQALKQRVTRERQRLHRLLDGLKTVTDGRGFKYPTRKAARESYFSLRERKLRGEYIDDGDWHQMMDYARAIRDPLIRYLRQSPSVMGFEAA